MNSELSHTQVDAFLQANACQVADNGFSEQVMSHLPERVGWERRLQHIWQLVCVTAAIVAGWLTDMVDVIATDVRVFIHTLPLDYSYTELFALAAIPMLIACALAARLVSREV